MPGGEKPDKIERETCISLCQTFGEKDCREENPEKEKRTDPEIEAGGSQSPEEGIKTSKDTNGMGKGTNEMENVRFGNSVV